MKSYLFDFDGTLVDSMPTFASVMTRILDENGIKYPKDIVKIITPLGYKGTAKYFKEELGISLSEEESLGFMLKYMQDEYTYRVPAKDGVIETLLGVKVELICRTCPLKNRFKNACVFDILIKED